MNILITYSDTIADIRKKVIDLSIEYVNNYDEYKKKKTQIPLAVVENTVEMLTMIKKCDGLLANEERILKECKNEFNRRYGCKKYKK